MNKFQDLKVWKKSMVLVSDVYKIASELPDDEKFGLISQIKRSAVSIPSNIAEGAGRNSNKEFSQFVSIATASSYELQTQILLIRNFNMADKENIDSVLSRIEEIQKMLFGLKKHLKSL